MTLRSKSIAALALAAGLALSACTGSPSGGGDTVTLHIVGFAVPEAAIHLFDRESGERLSTGR